MGKRENDYHNKTITNLTKRPPNEDSDQTCTIYVGKDPYTLAPPTVDIKLSIVLKS